MLHHHLCRTTRSWLTGEVNQGRSSCKKQICCRPRSASVHELTWTHRSNQPPDQSSRKLIKNTCNASVTRMLPSHRSRSPWLPQGLRPPHRGQRYPCLVHHQRFRGHREILPMARSSLRPTIGTRTCGPMSTKVVALLLVMQRAQLRNRHHLHEPLILPHRVLAQCPKYVVRT